MTTLMRFTIGFASLFLLLNCQTTERISMKEIFLNGSERFVDDTIFFTNCRVVKLELTENSALKRLSKVVLLEDKIYILDKAQKSVFLFDSLGHYVKRIGKRGMGPGEYLDIYDVAIDYDKSLLAFLCNKSIFYYDYSGEFIKKEDLPIDAVELAIENGYKHLALFGEDQQGYDILTVSPENKKSFKQIPSGRIPVKHLTSCFRFSSGNKIYFVQLFENQLFEVDSENCKPLLRFNLGKYALPEEMLNKEWEVDDFSIEYRKHNYIFAIGNLTAANDYFFFASNQPGVFAYKKTIEQLTVNTIINREYNFHFSNIGYQISDNNKIIFSIAEGQLSGLLDMRDNKPEYLTQKARSLLATEEEPNPILFIYDVK